jgi:hypothetical protein
VAGPPNAGSPLSRVIDMGLYLDLIRDTSAYAAAPDSQVCDQSDISDKRRVSSLMSLLSPSRIELAVTEDEAAVALPPNDPGWWRAQFEGRTSTWQRSGRYGQETAQRLAWGELQNRWHTAHGDRLPHHLCAGCGITIGAAEALDNIDGTRVHLAADLNCLIRYGQRWRTAATRGLIELGLRPLVGSDVSLSPAITSPATE